MPEYRAVRPCFHRKVLYKKGDVVNFSKDEKIPRHFIPAPTFSEDVVKKLESEEKEKKVRIRAQKAEDASK